MKRLFLACWALLALLALSAAPALADTAGAVQPGTSATQSDLQGCLYETSPAAASSGQQRAVHCDTAGNVSVTIPATGANVSDTPTIQNASYVSGNCMGGFRAVSIGTIQSVLSQISLSSQGGLATAKQVYVFKGNPTASTCTDKSTFSIGAADVSKQMISTTITPVAPTGTTISTGYASNLALGVPPGGVIYVAVVETTTETPASTTDLVLNYSAF